MQREKERRVERFLENFRGEGEEEEARSVLVEGGRPLLWGAPSPFLERRGEPASLLEIASPAPPRAWGEGLTVRSEQQPEGLNALYEERNQNYTLGNLFGAGARGARAEAALESEGEEDEEESEGGRRKFNKGLKLLSVIVQEIVVKKQSTTYKEVAQIILNDTLNSGSLQLSSKPEIAKEEQNIKRRVYDALNVLISAGILLKEGKRVRKNDVNKKIKISSKQMSIKALRNALVQKKSNLEKKTQQLELLSDELDGIKRLIARNKAAPTNKYISFPFIIVKPSALPNTEIKVNKQADCLKFALYSNHQFQVYGDLEVVAMIRPSLPPL